MVKVWPSSKIVEFQAKLLSWYNAEQRTLPWRDNPSLYKTVVSEFMLQQTRVQTVLPYFDKWMK
ncbi:MAG: A/G-specific adenine glycosylase, partial [Opitutae bacterium]|nr:A/G-specific adenine glycosylase [Opitutae bacterium]